MWVVGFVPPDEKWQQMADIFFACRKAKVDIPQEVESFFDEGEPDPLGQEVPLGSKVREYKADMHLGLEIDVADIPRKCKTIRFYNSY
jgi:hypothetical protein